MTGIITILRLRRPVRPTAPIGGGKGKPMARKSSASSPQDPSPVATFETSLDALEAIPVDDLHGRFRWMGLYTQRRQDIPGSRTGSLGPEELSDSYFMLRIRIDGGAHC